MEEVQEEEEVVKEEVQEEDREVVDEDVEEVGEAGEGLQSQNQPQLNTS